MSTIYGCACGRVYGNGDRFVVIDTEEPIPGHVARAAREAWWTFPSDADLPEAWPAAVAAALNAYRNPPDPKPEEPTGLHATVRDRHERVWNRDGLTVDGRRWWNRDTDRRADWDDLDVPADGVLYPGVFE